MFVQISLLAFGPSLAQNSSYMLFESWLGLELGPGLGLGLGSGLGLGLGLRLGLGSDLVLLRPAGDPLGAPSLLTLSHSVPQPCRAFGHACRRT